MAACAWKDLGPQAIGRSRGGLTTKTVVPSDSLGKLVALVTLPGRALAEAVEALIEGVSFKAFIADKACDADRLVEKLPKLKPGMKVVRPSKSNRRTPRDHDVEMRKRDA